MDVLWVPPETTDWAPVAAQVAERNPQAIGVALPSMVPFINALDAEGITPSDVPIQTAVTLLPPEQIKQLGSKADGIYLVTQVAPPTDTDNPGVKQMLKEFKAAGVDARPRAEQSRRGDRVVERAHLRRHRRRAPEAGDRLARLGHAGRRVQEGATGEPPRVRAVRLQQERVPGHPCALRVCASTPGEAMVLKVEDGAYKSVTPFGDATKPFKLES